MAYKYKVYTADKKVIEGKIDIEDEKLAEDALYRAGYKQVLSLEELPPRVSIETLIPSLFGVKVREVIDVSNQLTTLIQSGIPVLTALNLLAAQTRKKALAKIFKGLTEEIQGGKSLSQALARYPAVFGNTYRQIIAASEQAGTLETGLQQAAVYLEKRAHSQQKLVRAMVYLLFILVMAIGVSILLITVALPPMIQLFSSFNANLPWTTKALIAFSTFLIDNRVTILLVIALIVLIILGLSRMPSFKLAKDRLMLRLPVIGNITIERSMVMFCQTTSMLLKAGLRLPPILEIVIQTNRNQVLHSMFTDVRERLIQGEGLSPPMGENKLFPQLLVEMVLVGEKTGTLDSTLATLADFYEKKVDRKMDALIAMIEPVLTVIVGAVVIFLALSMITPMYSILKSI
jgi:type IV pilus assembly protein PilC